MVNLLKYYLSLCLLLSLLINSLAQEYPLYKKDFSEVDRRKLAASLNDGMSNYYQGTSAHQFLLREALMHDSTFADTYREFGAPCVKRGLAQQTMDYYQKAAELDPRGWMGWRGYLYLYFYRDYKNAIKDFDTLDALTPDFVDYPQSQSIDFMRGICYLQLEDYQKSIDYFDKHIRYETQEVGLEYIETTTFLFKGIAHFKLGEKEKAAKAFEQGLSNYRNNADLLFWLAKTRHRKGKPNEALSLIREAKEQFEQGNYHTRAYVEEFYQTYLSDIEELEAQILHRR